MNILNLNKSSLRIVVIAVALGLTLLSGYFIWQLFDPFKAVVPRPDLRRGVETIVTSFLSVNNHDASGKEENDSRYYYKDYYQTHPNDFLTSVAATQRREFARSLDPHLSYDEWSFQGALIKESERFQSDGEGHWKFSARFKGGYPSDTGETYYHYIIHAEFYETHARTFIVITNWKISKENLLNDLDRLWLWIWQNSSWVHKVDRTINWFFVNL